MTEDGEVNGSHEFPIHMLWSLFSCFLTLSIHCLFDLFSSLYKLILLIFYCPIKMPSLPKKLPGCRCLKIIILSSIFFCRIIFGIFQNSILLSNSHFTYLCVSRFVSPEWKDLEDRNNMLSNFVSSKHIYSQ